MDKYTKAIVAALMAGLMTYMVVLADGVTAGEWAQIAVAALAGGIATWAVPNAPKPGKPGAE